MASKLIQETVDAYFAAHWTACPILAENEDLEAPSDGSPFIMVQYFRARSSRATLARTYVHEGSFRVVINVPRGAGLDLMRQYGDDLVNMFRDVEIPVAGHPPLHCLVASEPFTNNNAESGNYITGAMVVPYRHVTDETS